MSTSRSSFMASADRDTLGYYHWSEQCPRCGVWHSYKSRDIYSYAAGCTHPTWCGECFAKHLIHRNKGLIDIPQE